MKRTLFPLKDAIRHPFAWPGGYEKAIYLSDGERICINCAREEFPQIARATRDNDRNGWEFMTVSVHWEGEPEYCCQCNKEMVSEYGPVEEES